MASLMYDFMLDVMRLLCISKKRDHAGNDSPVSAVWCGSLHVKSASSSGVMFSLAASVTGDPLLSFSWWPQTHSPFCTR